MRIETNQGIVEIGSNIYRWRYETSNEFFSIATLDDYRVVLKKIPCNKLIQLDIHQLIEQELKNIETQSSSSLKGQPVPSVSFVPQPEGKHDLLREVNLLSNQLLRHRLKKALRAENYESAAVYRKEMIKRGMPGF
jgi:hypothetical protein